MSVPKQFGEPRMVVIKTKASSWSLVCSNSVQRIDQLSTLVPILNVLGLSAYIFLSLSRLCAARGKHWHKLHFSGSFVSLSFPFPLRDSLCPSPPSPLLIENLIVNPRPYSGARVRLLQGVAKTR